MKMCLSEDLIQNYQEYLREEEKSKATVEKYIRDVRKFYAFLAPFSEFDKQDVLSFKETLIKEYQGSSVNSMLAALNSFLEFIGLAAFRVKRLKIHRQIFCREEQELTITEYKKLLQEAKRKGDKRLYHIMLTICSTGIRVSELAYITVPALKTGRAEVYGKNKMRTVLIPVQTRKTLLAYAEEQNITAGALFVTRSGRCVSRSCIWQEMKRLCRQAGVAEKKVFPHNLRHLFARTYYAREKDVVKLADILGHASVDTTRIYTLSTGKEHDLQISRLNLIF